MSGREDRFRGVADDGRVERDIAQFVAAHYPRLIRLAGLVCRDAIDSEDAVQQGLERAWRSRASLKDQERLGAWLDRIVVREAIRLGRDRRTLRQRLERILGEHDDIDLRVTRKAADPEVAVASRTALRHAFESLPASQRAVVALHLCIWGIPSRRPPR